MCNKQWPDRETFLVDETLELNGYGADLDKLEYGLFYFTHKVPECLSTMTINAGAFFDLYTGPEYSDNMFESDECPKFCLKKEKLDRCAVLCENAFVREIIHIIAKRKKRENKEAVSYTVDEGTYTLKK